VLQVTFPVTTSELGSYCDWVDYSLSFASLNAPYYPVCFMWVVPRQITQWC